MLSANSTALASPMRYSIKLYAKSKQRISAPPQQAIASPPGFSRFSSEKLAEPRHPQKIEYNRTNPDNMPLSEHKQRAKQAIQATRRTTYSAPATPNEINFEVICLLVDRKVTEQLFQTCCRKALQKPIHTTTYTKLKIQAQNLSRKLRACIETFKGPPSFSLPRPTGIFYAKDCRAQQLFN